MALARLVTFTPLTLIKSADVNGEFNNILGNAIALVSPTTGAINFNLQAHTNLVSSALSATSGSTGQVLTVNAAGTPSWLNLSGLSTALGVRILQLIGGAVAGPVTATSTTLTDAGVQIQITPASTNSRITIQYSFNANVPNTAGANNAYSVQIATSSGVIPGTAHTISALSGAGGNGSQGDMSWSIGLTASTGPYPTSYKIQHLESSIGVNPTLSSFNGFLTEYSS